jgi:sialate O-acetylesterase
MKSQIVKNLKLFSVIFILFFLSPNSGFSQGSIHLPYFFGDNMVLQRQKPIKIWGTSSFKKSFEIEFTGEKRKVKPDASGKWKVEFSSKEAGGPYEMRFFTDSAFTLKNILIGDVYICSGQSNMEWDVLASFNSGFELHNANFPEIRNFRVSHKISTSPLANTPSSHWQITTPDNAASYSAVSYFFARNLYLWEKVPIGIINSSWGGTVIEAWTGLESIATHPDFKEKSELVLSARKNNQAFVRAPQGKDGWTTKLESLDKGYKEKWYSPEYTPSDWSTMIAPGFWENQGLKDFDGVVWLRKEFYVPAEMVNRNLVINLERLNNTDETYFNGVKVGVMTWPIGRRIYFVPANLVKEGKNIIAIRLENTSGNGGFDSKNAIDLRLQEAVESDRPLIIPLSGTWLYKPSLTLDQIPAKSVPGSASGSAFTSTSPSSIYNGMIAPFADLPLKGIIWYQGETNSFRAYQYRSLFPLMINNWRLQFKQGDLPFIFAQLSSFGVITEIPGNSYWQELREAQMMALSLPKTGMVVTIDVGNPYDVHPTNKQEVGRRFALEAEKIIYGKSELQTSPVYESMRVEGSMVHLKFTNSANGLISKNGILKGFAITGQDKKFIWAKAKIEGNEVIVWNETIPDPVAVRYAWSDCPVESSGANLFNKEELPASPFRTDNWECITINNK